MNVELVRYPDEFDWQLCKECTMITVGIHKPTPVSDTFKRKILAARHSPIRELHFVFKLTDVPYWVAMHLRTHHVGCQTYISTQRNDRQDNYDRNEARQDAPVSAMFSVNAESLITIANKRLCRKAAKETRELVQQMCDLVIEKCPEFESELIPMCARNGGICYEIRPCTDD